MLFETIIDMSGDDNALERIEQEKKKCFLNCQRTAPIHLFTPETLKTCADSLERRKVHQLKYSDVELPQEVNDTIGYHSKCRNNFNALKAQFKSDNLNESAISINPSPILDNIFTEKNVPGANNSIDSFLNIDESQEFQYKDPSEKLTCVLCNRSGHKKVRGRSEAISESKQFRKWEDFMYQAILWEDFELVAEIKTYVDVERKVPYHKTCRLNYNNLIAKRERRSEGVWHRTRECYKVAFATIFNFVRKFVIDKKNACTLDLIYRLFKEVLLEQYNKFSGDEQPTLVYTKHVSEKLLKKFRRKIKMEYYKRTRVILPYGGVTFNIDTLQDDDILQEAALLLRRVILDNASNKFGPDITIQNLIAGECEIPKELTHFLNTLLAGFNFRRRKSPRTARLVKSFSSDIIQAVSNGKTIPSKHIVLGSTIKSFTNSKKIVRILQRYGHICSYNVLEELETEATFSCVDSSRICSSDVVSEPGLLTVCAFDNFDRFIDSVTVQNTTLNDTVGIVVQNIIDREESGINNKDDEITGHFSSQRKRRRTFEAYLPELQPYLKKPKIQATVLPYDSPERNVIPESLDHGRKVDLAWMMSHAFGITTPMWVGFNAKIDPNDDQVIQKVFYLTPINEPPTDHAVVLETMRRAIQIADECGEQYAQVTYDLGIARIALPLQNTERNEFRRLFIHIGGFHIQMSFFKAIGTFITSCGLETVLVESDLLGSGSISGFLSGKHFNRCKRLHVLVYLCLQKLQFQNFLDSKEIEVNPNIKQLLQKFQRSECTIEDVVNDSSTQDILNEFVGFQQETLNEKYGKTQKFYAIYLQLIGYYLLFERSIRTAEFELYCYAIDKMTNLFFTLNHQNYARWLVWYLNTLLNVDNTHPGLKEQFRKGSFGCKRTCKPFSRMPIDLTLEQTINADAGRRLTGIRHITNSIAARQRWAINHGLRCALISKVMEECGLDVVQDITNDLLHHRIVRSEKHMHSFTSTLTERMNPFSSDVRKDVLLNVSTGKAAPDEVSEFLLNIEIIGENMKKCMIEECKENEKNFGKYVIKRNKILNFASCIKKMKLRVNGKIQEVKLQKNLFGRLLGIAWGSKENINMEKVLSYPLTPVPLSLCHMDGTINKTDKSVITKILETYIQKSDFPEEHCQPNNVNVVIIDGMFLLHQLTQVPSTLGAVAIKILESITTINPNAKEIYILFDEYKSPSIKDNEHILRDNFNVQYEFKGPDQKRPSDFGAELKNINFKKSFITFIMDYWASESKVKHYIKDKQIFVSFERCQKYKVAEDGSVVCEIIPHLKCEGHEEADTKIVFFLCQMEDKEVVIKCCDSDIFVIILGNMMHIPQSLKVWLLYSTGNNRRYININEIYKALGTLKCSGLPAFHAFTGCDYNPAFFRKGKKKPWELYKKSEKIQQAFAVLQDPSNQNYEAAFSIIEEFVCKMYATTKNCLGRCSNVDEARLLMFSYSYGHNIEPTDKFKQKLLEFDPCILPPCKRELHQQILRTAYIGHLWKNAFSAVPNTSLNVQEFGWLLENDAYTFKWFEGDDVPQNIQEIIDDPQENRVEEDDIVRSADNEDDKDESDDDDSDTYSQIDGETTEEEPEIDNNYDEEMEI